MRRKRKRKGRREEEGEDEEEDEAEKERELERKMIWKERTIELLNERMEGKLYKSNCLDFVQYCL